MKTWRVSKKLFLLIQSVKRIRTHWMVFRQGRPTVLEQSIPDTGPPPGVTVTCCSVVVGRSLPLPIFLVIERSQLSNVTKELDAMPNKHNQV